MNEVLTRPRESIAKKDCTWVISPVRRFIRVPAPDLSIRLKGLAQFIADPVGRHIHKHSVQGAAKTSEQCNQDHPDPVIDNKSQIAVAAAGAQYPVIHNYSHNAGLQQIHKNFTNHQQRADDSIMKVFSDKLPHSRVSPFQIKIMIIFYSKFKYGKYFCNMEMHPAVAETICRIN